MAGRIPQHFIDELVARTDIVEVIGNRVQLKRAGREYKACCPFHDEKTPSFTVSPDKQFYHCFGCGAHGTALGFLMEYDHLGFVEAVEELAARAGLEVPREGGDAAGAAAERGSLRRARARGALLPPVADRRAACTRVSRGSRPDRRQSHALRHRLRAVALGRPARALRDEPGRSGRHSLRAGLVIERSATAATGAGHYDRFRDRVMFPIRDVRGRTIGFGGRILDKGEPKYLNSPETELFHKGRELYGLYEARQATRSLARLLVVEGYMDVVRLHQAGITYAVATLGTATTPEHLQRIFRLVGEVVFCFDGDRAGRAAAWRALENAVSEVKQGRQLRFLFLPEGHDPDSLVGEEGAEAFETRIRGAVPLADYLIGELASRCDVASVDGRARLVELARPLILRIPSDVYRELLTAQLASVVGMPAARLTELLGAAAGTDAAAPDRSRRAPPRRPPVNASLAGRGNLVRQAVSLLVHHPSAAAAPADLEALSAVDRPGVPLLLELLTQLREDPAASTAVLLERWRERPEHVSLARLAATECLVLDPAAAAAELGSAIARLVAEETPGRRLDELLARARDMALSDPEKQELQELLRARRDAGQPGK